MPKVLLVPDANWVGPFGVGLDHPLSEERISRSRHPRSEADTIADRLAVQPCIFVLRKNIDKWPTPLAVRATWVSPVSHTNYAQGYPQVMPTQTVGNTLSCVSVPIVTADVGGAITFRSSFHFARG